MPATRVESKRLPNACGPKRKAAFIEEDEEMTRMQRLQPWLMAGIALFGLSAAVIGLALNPRISPTWFWPLQQVSISLLVIGAILIVIGIFVVLLVPGLMWQFGARGKLYRTLQKQTKAGRRIELRKTGDWEPQRNWQRDVMAILEHDKGDWQPEIVELGRLGDSYYDPKGNRPCIAHEVLARQIRSIEQFAARLYRGEV